MAKRVSKASPKHVEPEEISQEVPESEPVHHLDRAANGKTISGAEAVRQALAAGMDAPGDIHGYVKGYFGLDIPKPMISSYKSQEKARQAKKAGGSKSSSTPGRKPRMAQLEKVVEAIQPTVGGGIIADLAAIKGLVGKLGVEEVQKIAALFG